MQYTVHVTVNCQLRWIVYACEIYKLTHVTGFIQKIATIFQGLFKDFSRTTLDFQGQPIRNIISQTVQKCIFPVYSNKTLRL